MNKILVLSGGGTPGICVHAGALKSLYERGHNFNIVIGMIFVRFIYGRGPKVGYRGLFRKLTGR